jgi:hypothetical protein
MDVQIKMAAFVGFAAWLYANPSSDASAGKAADQIPKEPAKALTHARDIFELNSLAWLRAFQVTKLRVNDSYDVLAIDTFLLKMPLQVQGYLVRSSCDSCTPKRFSFENFCVCMLLFGFTL